MIEVTLRQLKHSDGTHIHDWSRHIVFDGTMILYRLNEPLERRGFDFIVVEACGSEYPAPSDVSMHYHDVLFSGSACFDGLRHLWMGSEQTDNDGYLYYASAVDLSAVFVALRELELKHCSLDDIPKGTRGGTL